MHNPVGYNYYCFGVSHKNAAAELRQFFALTTDQEHEFYERIFPQHQCAGFIINTCNRTTFFLHGKHNESVEAAYLQLIQNQHLEDSSVTAINDLTEVGYRYIGNKAITHLLELCSGLDSQILGDFEIVGQVKKAFLKAKSHRATDGLLERALNTAVHCSRKIKNETGLSTGSASTSYAAASFLSTRLSTVDRPQILVLGTGEIGHRTLDNWVALHGPDGVTVANRTDEKAQEIAAKLGVRCIAWNAWKQELNAFDAVVNAAHAPELLVRADEITANGPKLFIDLSMPMRIDPKIAAIPGAVVLNVDDLSKHVATTMDSRAAALPTAYAIVNETLEKFRETERAHSAAPLIHQVQLELAEQWRSKAHDPEKIERLSAKIECRLFEHVRKDPRQIQQLKKWLRE